MLLSRKSIWLVLSLWVLSQSAVLAHGFELHEADTDCYVCVHGQNDDGDAILPAANTFLVFYPVTQSVRSLAVNHTVAFVNIPKARGPPTII